MTIAMHTTTTTTDVVRRAYHVYSGPISGGYIARSEDAGKFATHSDRESARDLVIAALVNELAEGLRRVEHPSDLPVPCPPLAAGSAKSMDTHHVVSLYIDPEGIQVADEISSRSLAEEARQSAWRERLDTLGTSRVDHPVTPGS